MHACPQESTINSDRHIAECCRNRFPCIYKIFSTARLCVCVCVTIAVAGLGTVCVCWFYTLWKHASAGHTLTSPICSVVSWTSPGLPLRRYHQPLPLAWRRAVFIDTIRSIDTRVHQFSFSALDQRYVSRSLSVLCSTSLLQRVASSLGCQIRLVPTLLRRDSIPVLITCEVPACVFFVFNAL